MFVTKCLSDALLFFRALLAMSVVVKAGKLPVKEKM